jgi:hypothetical protein
MLKHLFKGSSVLVFFLVGNFSALAQAPAFPTQVQLAQSLGQTVSQEELQQLASLLPRLREIGQTAQQRTTQVIEQSGLTLERFQELSQAQQSPGTELSSPVTPEEQQSFNQLTSEIELIQQEILSQQEQALRAGGLEPDRFNEILMAIQQDQGLRQQLQQIIDNN